MLLRGKILNKDTETEGIYILNKNSEATTITNQHGEFEIKVKNNDTLVFSALQYEIKFLVITQEIYESEYAEVTLTEKINQLEPIFLSPHKLTGNLALDLKNHAVENPITAESVGLPKATYTLPDRNHRLLHIATGGPLDLLINTLNGRIKRLRKLIKQQKEDTKLENTKERFETDFYVKDLKIPEDYIDRFMYFCATDPAFKDIQDENTLIILAYLQQKSMDFRAVNNLDTLGHD